MTEYPQIAALPFYSSGPADTCRIDGRTARSEYGALFPRYYPAFAADLMREAEKAGCWETGIESYSSNRGIAINADLYGYDEQVGLAVVQVRECYFGRRYNQVRKNYYLVGRVESGEVFAHPIDSPCRSKKALVTPEATVSAVLQKIWDCPAEDLPYIVRQGDVALVPVRSLPKGAAVVPEGEATIRATHRLTGDVWRCPDGTLYTRRGARLTHTKREHAPVRAKGGYYRVQPGVRVEQWSFSLARGD